MHLAAARCGARVGLFVAFEIENGEFQLWLTGIFSIELITSPVGHLRRTLGIETFTETMSNAEPGVMSAGTLWILTGTARPEVCSTNRGW